MSLTIALQATSSVRSGMTTVCLAWGSRRKKVGTLHHPSVEYPSVKKCGYRLGREVATMGCLLLLVLCIVYVHSFVCASVHAGVCM